MDSHVFWIHKWWTMSSLKYNSSIMWSSRKSTIHSRFPSLYSVGNDLPQRSQQEGRPWPVRHIWILPEHQENIIHNNRWGHYFNWKTFERTGYTTPHQINTKSQLRVTTTNLGITQFCKSYITSNVMSHFSVCFDADHSQLLHMFIDICSETPQTYATSSTPYAITACQWTLRMTQSLNRLLMTASMVAHKGTSIFSHSLRANVYKCSSVSVASTFPSRASMTNRVQYLCTSLILTPIFSGIRPSHSIDTRFVAHFNP